MSAASTGCSLSEGMRASGRTEAGSNSIMVSAREEYFALRLPCGIDSTRRAALASPISSKSSGSSCSSNASIGEGTVAAALKSGSG